MIRKSMLCVLFATAACTPPQGPVTYVAPVPAAQETAFTCAFRTVNEMGFTVMNADRDAGFLAAEKRMAGYGTHDLLSVAVVEAGNATRTLRVTATTPSRPSRSGYRPSDDGAASSHGRAAARIVVQTCAPGATPVLQQAGAAFQVQAPVAR